MKLTLTMEPELIEEAKEYAKAQKQSLSNIVRNHLKAVIRETKADKVKTDDIEISPFVKSLMGSVKPPKDFDYNYKKAIRKAKADKYWNNE